MKHAVNATAVFASGTVLRTASLAQSRHDAKPYGFGETTVSAAGGSGTVMRGRHDERPHNAKKTAPQEQDAKGGANEGSCFARGERSCQ